MDPPALRTYGHGMNDAQTWTALVFLMTALIGVLGYAGRNIEHRFDRVDQRLDRFEDRFDRLEAKIDGRFDRLEARVDGLDRDVTALTRRGLGDQ